MHSPFALITHGHTCASPELCVCPGAGDNAGESFFSYELTREEKGGDLLHASQELVCY